MTEVKCVNCGAEGAEGQEGWVACEDCGSVFCPDCLGESVPKAHLSGLLSACPKCKGDLKKLDWT